MSLALAAHRRRLAIHWRGLRRVGPGLARTRREPIHGGSCRGIHAAHGPGKARPYPPPRRFLGGRASKAVVPARGRQPRCADRKDAASGVFTAGRWLLRANQLVQRRA
ncbi:hypothetical protein F9K92_08315 [Stenotrophomonas rhizophila]|uniref:Uncharacterized protein n=1 Tax=Stenotrophomonas rhizophila TaxID=216778 RepID=A0A7V7YHD9_9GAMM|nr:hypothetical protein F9K92_08315 [Stenotrophomonas rhizophila]